jgi:2-methylisocitrate lyase-like PEP mutase family enzyme
MRLAIHRANLFRRAGADCLYPPGAADIGTVNRLVREIDGPLNVVTGLAGVRLSPRALLDAGVQRVSLGGAIARASLGFVRQCARELRERETVEFADVQISQPDLNALFADAHEARRSTAVR